MNSQKVLFVASEMSPLAKSGGLGDVVGALPYSLREIGVDARVILPLYKPIKEKYLAKLTFVRWTMIKLGWRSMYSGLYRMDFQGLPIYFIDNEYYFAHDQIYLDYSFDIERFSFFQRAVLEALGMPMDFFPDILHLNDWQTGMIPCLLEAHYRPYGFHKNLKTVFTIHNLRYQGIHGVERIADLMDLPSRFLTDAGILHDGVPNFMKAGIVYADKVTTVSPSYAEEMLTDYYGEGLNGLLMYYSHKLQGILNGIDTNEYDPETDPMIPANYNVKNWKAGKAVCKAEVQKQYDLNLSPDTPLFGIVSRLVDQKGLDLLIHIIDELLAYGVQIAILGTGDPYYELMLEQAAIRNEGDMAVKIMFSNKMAHRLYAGADLLLMPSLFEPCGLSQMIAMRYGTIPVVRETGGLRDTVIPYNQYTGEGNGFSFCNINAHELLFTARYAADVYRQSPEAWNGLVRAAMESDYSWERSAQIYKDMYAEVAAPEKVEAVEVPAAPETPPMQKKNAVQEDEPEDESQPKAY